jgi:hypothetical protein
MALEKFRASPLPIPPAEYSPEHFRQLIRVIELYFSQLDSLTPNQAESYRANFFYGGEFIGDLTGDVVADTITTDLLNSIQAYIQAATINTLTANYAKLQSILNNRIVSKDVMADHFYANDFEGFGDGVIFPHIAASDSTDQVATGDNTATVVNFNTLDSGFGWTLNSPGSATASYAGIYKITFSLQFANTANAVHDASVWLKVNNNDVVNSTTNFSIPARKSAGVPSFVAGYSEITFEMDVGDDVELYWATDLAGSPSVPTDGVYIYHDTAQASPYARPAIPSVIGSITFVSALNKTKVAPLPVYGYGQVGAVTVSTNLG